MGFVVWPRVRAEMKHRIELSLHLGRVVRHRASIIPRKIGSLELQGWFDCNGT